MVFRGVVKNPPLLGVPAEAQRSGFGGERRSCGVSETCPPGRGERYETSDDEPGVACLLDA